MPKYKVIGMLRSGLQKELNDAMYGGGAAPYLLEQQRLVHLVTVAAGRLEQGGNLLDTSEATNPEGAYIYVMDGDGRIFAAPSSVVHHHSAFLAGNPVAAAGAITVDNGRLTEVCDQSGHYMPPIEYSKQLLAELKSRGVDVSGVTRQYQGGKKSDIKKKMKKLKLKPFERLYPEGVKGKMY